MFCSNFFRPAGFIQVGDWVYPLIPGHSPVLLSANGAYIFPNITTDHSDSNSQTVGLVLSSSLDPAYEETFCHFLATMASLQVGFHAVILFTILSAIGIPFSRFISDTIVKYIVYFRTQKTYLS